MQNSEEFVRAKSNEAKKSDFQPIQFSIKALREKDRTEFTLEKGNLSSLGIYNASTETDNHKFDIKSDFSTPDLKGKNSNESTELLKTENSVILLKYNNNLEFNSKNPHIADEKYKNKRQNSEKDTNQSTQKNGIGSFLNSSNQKDDSKNIHINTNNIKNDKENLRKNSPADKKNKIINLSNPKENLINNFFKTIFYL